MQSAVPEKQSFCFPADKKTRQILTPDVHLEKNTCKYFFRLFFFLNAHSFYGQLQTRSKWDPVTHIGCWGCDHVIPDRFSSTCLELLWQKEKGEWITGLHGYKSSCKQAGGSATGPPGSRGARGSSRPAWVASHRGLLEQGPAGGKVPGGHLPGHKANPGHHACWEARLQWVFMLAERLGQHLCSGRRTCPTCAGFRQLCPAGEPAAGNSTGLMLGTLLGGGYLYVFSHLVLCLLLCVGWWLGAFQKYKYLSLESAHPIAQHSTVLAAQPFLYSLCTGQGFFHFMHHP